MDILKDKKKTLSVNLYLLPLIDKPKTFRQFQLSTNLGSFGGVEMKDNVRDN